LIFLIKLVKSKSRWKVLTVKTYKAMPHVSRLICRFFLSVCWHLFNCFTGLIKMKRKATKWQRDRVTNTNTYKQMEH